MRHIYSRFFALAILFSFLIATNTSAELYGVAQEIPERIGGDNPEIVVFMEEEVPQAKLYSIDPATGEVELIGPTGFFACTGLDFEPQTNRAFAVCAKELGGPDNGEVPPIEEFPVVETREDNPEQFLVQLDIETGQGTEIGPLQVESELDATDISFRSDGTLFAILNGLSGILIGGGGGAETKNRLVALNKEVLATINTTTGQATIIGQTETGRSFDAIGFSGVDNLYHATDNLLDDADVNMLNDATANATNLAQLDIPELTVVSTLDLKPNTGELFGMLVPFVLLGNPDDDFPAPTGFDIDSRVEFLSGSTLIKLDPESGDIEVIGLSTGLFNQMGAIAFLNQQRQMNVPTLSEYGLIATSIFLLLAAVIYLRRRNLQTEN